MNEWIDGWINEWMSEWMDEWMNEWILLQLQSKNHAVNVLCCYDSEYVQWYHLKIKWINEWMNEWILLQL